MGKTVPAVTQMIFEAVAETKPLYVGLDPADQRRLDKMFKLVIKHKVAIANAKAMLPIEVLCILMLLEVYQQNNELHHAQYAEIKLLRKALEAAGLISEEENVSIEEDDTSLIDMVLKLEAAEQISSQVEP